MAAVMVGVMIKLMITIMLIYNDNINSNDNVNVNGTQSKFHHDNDNVNVNGTPSMFHQDNVNYIGIDSIGVEHLNEDPKKSDVLYERYLNKIRTVLNKKVKTIYFIYMTRVKNLVMISLNISEIN